MSRAAIDRRAVLGGGLLLALAATGCTPTSLAWILQGDDKKKPEYPLPPKAGKKEITVAILANGSATLGVDFIGAERELAALVAKRLMEETKTDRHPIRVIEQSKFDKFKTTPGRDWRTMSPGEIGKDLKADYVLDMTVTAMSMYQPEYGREFYQGKANVQVVVYDAEIPDKPLQDYVSNPPQEPKSTAATSPSQYRRWFIDQVATEIAYRHIPHLSATRLSTPH